MRLAPSHFPLLLRTRSRARRSFATVMPHRRPGGRGLPSARPRRRRLGCRAAIISIACAFSMRCPVFCMISEAVWPLEEGGEAWPLLDGIGAFDRGVVVLIDDHVGRVLGERLNGLARALVGL